MYLTGNMNIYRPTAQNVNPDLTTSSTFILHRSDSYKYVLKEIEGNFIILYIILYIKHKYVKFLNNVIT